MLGSCEICHNEYDKAFKVIMGNEEHIFDSFECAIHALAPRCGHCSCRVIGHGVESHGRFYCCVSCAEAKGEGEGLADRV